MSWRIGLSLLPAIGIRISLGGWISGGSEMRGGKITSSYPIFIYSVNDLCRVPPWGDGSTSDDSFIRHGKRRQLYRLVSVDGDDDLGDSISIEMEAPVPQGGDWLEIAHRYERFPPSVGIRQKWL